MRDLENLGRWPGVIAEIHPRNYSAVELEQAILRLHRDFYSWSSMFRRLPFPKSEASVASWVMNFAQKGVFNAEASRTNFGGV